MTHSDLDKSLEVIHKPEIKRFEINLGDSLAFLEYDIRNDNMIFLHTETPPPWEGKGVGSRLAVVGLEYAREHLYRVIPVCPFIEAYIARHPEYKPILRK
jgi:predicted GNAT family acetyltransferase